MKKITEETIIGMYIRTGIKIANETESDKGKLKELLGLNSKIAHSNFGFEEYEKLTKLVLEEIKNQIEYTNKMIKRNIIDVYGIPRND